MKRLVALTLLIVVGLALINMICEDTETQQATGNKSLVNPDDYPPVENLDFEVINDLDGNPGGAVKVTWDPPAGEVPDMYVVKIDDGNSEPVAPSPFSGIDSLRDNAGC